MGNGDARHRRPADVVVGDQETGRHPAEHADLMPHVHQIGPCRRFNLTDHLEPARCHSADSRTRCDHAAPSCYAAAPPSDRERKSGARVRVLCSDEAMDLPRPFVIRESTHRIHDPLTPAKTTTSPESVSTWVQHLSTGRHTAPPNWEWRPGCVSSMATPPATFRPSR